MPTYVYRCAKCGEELEVQQSMSDPPLKRCRKCRGQLRRVFQPVGIVLKGSGFYKTDYGRSKKPADEPKSGASKDPSSKDTSSGSSSKSGSSKPDSSKSDSSGSSSSASSGSKAGASSSD